MDVSETDHNVNSNTKNDFDEEEEMRAIDHLIVCHQNSTANIPINWREIEEIDDNEDIEFSDFNSNRHTQNIANFGPFIPPNQRNDAPLASILSEKLQHYDPKHFFPDFERGEILHFSRLLSPLMKSSSKAQIWWSSKTSRKKIGVEKESKKEKDTEMDVNAEIFSDNELKLNFGLVPGPEECIVDDELRLMLPTGSLYPDDDKNKGKIKNDVLDIPPWRFGPAQMWYDQLGVPANGKGFDYGFKLRPPGTKKYPEIMAGSKEDHLFPPEKYLPVNLINWEDDIVYDGEEIKEEVIKKLTCGKQPICGWIPTQYTRTYESFMAALKSGAFAQLLSSKSSNIPSSRNFLSKADEFSNAPGPSQSIFPMDNYDLINTRWEDDIIWDSENLDKIPEPKVLTLDFWDDPKLFGMPEDKAPESEFPQDGSKFNCSDSTVNNMNSALKIFDRKEHQFTKKSKMILNQVQQRQKLEEEEQLESSMAQMTDRDPFNLSNDEYYQPKNATRQITSFSGSLLVHHSIPAQNINRAFFPTHLNPFKLRHFHRIPLGKRHLRSLGGGGRFTPVRTLTRHIQRLDQSREKRRLAEGGGELFFMREIWDLSAKDGQLLLLEYAEEHPPLVQQTGMASKIRNYYKRVRFLGAIK